MIVFAVCSKNVLKMSKRLAGYFKTDNVPVYLDKEPRNGMKP